MKKRNKRLIYAQIALIALFGIQLYGSNILLSDSEEFISRKHLLNTESMTLAGLTETQARSISSAIRDANLSNEYKQKMWALTVSFSILISGLIILSMFYSKEENT